jgi:hypothetical protein
MVRCLASIWWWSSPIAIAPSNFELTILMFYLSSHSLRQWEHYNSIKVLELLTNLPSFQAHMGFKMGFLAFKLIYALQQHMKCSNHVMCNYTIQIMNYC